MSPEQAVTPAAGIGQTVVPYATFQEAFQKDPGQLNDAVLAATAQAAGGDPVEQQRLVANWHNAIGALSQNARAGTGKGRHRRRDHAHAAERAGLPFANAPGEACDGRRAGGYPPTGADRQHTCGRQLRTRGAVREIRQRRPCRLVADGARTDFQTAQGCLDRPAAGAADDSGRCADRRVRRLGDRPLRRSRHCPNDCRPGALRRGASRGRYLLFR